MPFIFNNDALLDEFPRGKKNRFYTYLSEETHRAWSEDFLAKNVSGSMLGAQSSMAELALRVLMAVTTGWKLRQVAREIINVTSNRKALQRIADKLYTLAHLIAQAAMESDKSK